MTKWAQLLFLLSCYAAMTAMAAEVPRFQDYPVSTVFKGKPAAPKLADQESRRYRTRIREGVRKGWGVSKGGSHGPESNVAGPNFAGHYIVIHWGCGTGCLQMAVVDAVTGDVFAPPAISRQAKSFGFSLPIMTLGNRVSRAPDIHFRLDSRLLIIRSTPDQIAEAHPTYDFYFLREAKGWKLLKRILVPVDTKLEGDP